MLCINSSDHTVGIASNLGVLDPESILGCVTPEAFKEDVVIFLPGIPHWGKVQQLVDPYRYYGSDGAAS